MAYSMADGLGVHSLSPIDGLYIVYRDSLYIYGLYIDGLHRLSGSLFIINAISGKKIEKFSAIPSEQEVPCVLYRAITI